MSDERPEALSKVPDDRVIQVDARPLLEAGQEPFGLIMDAVRRVATGGALRLRATFRPTPLFHVLAAQGFESWVERGEGTDWVVWFYRDADPLADTDTASSFDENVAALQKDLPELRERLRRSGDRWILDVRDLPPPEPMEYTLQVLHALPSGTVLEQINQRIPQFLFPLLDARGCRYEVTRNDERDVRVEIVAA